MVALPAVPCWHPGCSGRGAMTRTARTGWPLLALLLVGSCQTHEDQTSLAAREVLLGGAGTASPAMVEAGRSTLLTVTVNPGTIPPGVVLAVTADLSAIGGSPAQAFVDDGTAGDVTAGDLVFSF